MTATGCPACQSDNVLSTGRDASGSWKCMSCGLAFDDFASPAQAVTDYAAKQDEPYAPRPVMSAYRRAAWYSGYGS